MSLNNFRFILYFAVFYISILLIENFGKWRKKNTVLLVKSMLLLISYAFIGYRDLRFIYSLGLVTVISYVFGIELGKTVTTKKDRACTRRLILIIGIVLLLSFLAFFKYCNFFLNNIARILKIDCVSINLILPIGISFYIFSAISYLIDIYRRKYKPEKNFIDVALYICFFPKVVSGPIVRGDEFLIQCKNYNGLKWSDFKIGIQIFVFGMFKKMVLADHLGRFVDAVFFAPTAYHSFTIFLAVISYSLQIYFDFSGYSDMAIGISRILGYRFNANFNLPYTARNMGEFWKRWHISLSSWFQEYLYIPLGGNRKGKCRTYLNLMIVMTLSGLWHGAGWTFVLWGGAHGMVSCIQKFFEPFMKDIIGKTRYGVKCISFLSITITFIIVSLLWVIFRADSIENAYMIIKGVFVYQQGIIHLYSWTFFSIVILLCATMFAYLKSERKFEKVNGFYPVMNLERTFSLAIFFAFIGITIILGYFGNTEFIYGKF